MVLKINGDIVGNDAKESISGLSWNVQPLEMSRKHLRLYQRVIGCR